MRKLVPFLLFPAVVSHSYATEVPDVRQHYRDALQRMETHRVDQAIEQGKLYIKSLEIEQERVKAANAVQKREGEQYIAAFEIRHAILRRQLIYHPIILCIVVLIAFSGICFSGLQAWRDFRMGGASNNSIKISKDGLEISSAVIGLIALGMSFGFFYLYATQIYPVTELGGTAAVSVPQVSATANQGDAKPSDQQKK